MERIIYRKTLDVHKSGVQFILQGFQTADNMSRTLELSLMASGDTIDLPLEQLIAVAYITTPNATEPSINECTIKDNNVVCDILPIVEEGITEVQLKLIETGVDGAKSVLAAPKFAIEVSKSNMDEEGAIQNTTFSALETALAKAKGVYDSRVTRIVLSPDCIFSVYYADGTVYTNDALRDVLVNGESLIAKSYARGGTGVRDGEDTDNSMYYSNVSKSSSIEANAAMKNSLELLEEVRKHGVYTAFSFNFEKGELEYISPMYKFNIDEETGELVALNETYTFDETIKKLLNEYIDTLPTIESIDYPGCYYRIVNGETEWINPPMIAGVEYRTTERFAGSPVYVRLVSMELADNKQVSKIYCSTQGGATNVVRYDAHITTGAYDESTGKTNINHYNMPLVEGTSTVARCLLTQWSVIFQTYRDGMGVYTGYCTVWYTKD